MASRLSGEVSPSFLATSKSVGIESFEASLVQHLQPVLNTLGEDIAAHIAALPGSAGTVYLRLRQALDDAFLRNAAVAIIHLS